MGAHDQRADSACALHHEDQSRGSPREKVLSVDRWVDPVVFVHFPADVDFEGGIRRVWSNYCAPQVLLMCFLIGFYSTGRVEWIGPKVTPLKKGSSLFFLSTAFLHANP